MTDPGRPQRAVVVGVGMIGRIHINALRRNGVEVVSVVASSAARSAAAADQFRVPRGDPDLATALAGAAPDVVHICTPNHQHYAMARAALAAGKHVVCEKPLTLLPAEAADLRTRAADAGLVNAVCFNNRFYPLVQEMAARQRSGSLGSVFAVRASIVDDSLWAESDTDWRLDPTTGGPSVVTTTTGSHLIDLTSFILGDRVAAVCADFHTAYPARGAAAAGPGGEEIANLLVRYESGARGALSMSHMAVGHPYRLAVEIDAAESGAGWNSERPNELLIGHRARPNEIVTPDPREASEAARGFFENPGAYREGFSETFRLLFREVYRDVGRAPAERGEPAYPTFAAGHAGLIVHDAIMRSVRDAGWVDVDWPA
jgi:predicted dehydrogenase